MLMEQTIVSESISAGLDSIPIGFIISEDGRTLFALSDHDDGILELVSTPIALMHQNNINTFPSIKAANENVIFNAPIFHMNYENFNANRLQQTTIFPVPAPETEEIAIPEEITNVPIETTETGVTFSNSILKNEASTEEILGSKTPAAEDQPKVRRTPGRPKKDEIALVPELKCDICGQGFNKQVLYKRHMVQHAKEKPHRCPKCSASFNVPTNFTLHMATHNTGEPKCPECGRKFARMASLKSHMLLHEKEENLFCTECEDAFSTKTQLDAHLKLHNEKWTTEDVRKCKMCNKQFTQPALYRLHIREHYRLQTKIVKQTKRGTKHKTMYKCKICLKFFQKPSQLMRHIRVHTGEKPFKCSVCGRAFTQKGSLQIHMSQHDGIRPYSCGFCNSKFSQKGNLNAHILRVHNAPDGESIYGCTYCSCVFKKLGNLNSHIKKMHSNPAEQEPPSKETSDNSPEADMQATVDSVMSQLASLESATTVNVNSDSTTTDYAAVGNKNDILQLALRNSGLSGKEKNANEEESASKKAEARTVYVTLLDRAPDGSTRKYITIKQRCIGNTRWYVCSFCHKEFKKPSDLLRHLRIHTQEKPFKCSYCFRSFALKSTMIAHERTHTGTKKYSCGSCEKTFACHSSLSAHARLHVKPYVCTICDKTFNANALLKNHMKIHAKGKSKISPEAEVLVPQIVLEEPLIITDAGNKISVAQVQSKNKQTYDASDVARPHKCWVCLAAFRKISHLKTHYRRHTGERPYKCHKCDRRFTSNSVLKSHLHTHEDLRPFSCSVCNTKFSTQSSMKRHLVTHSNKRPFMCPYCHKTFKTSVNCRKHMKIHKHELALQQLEQQKNQGTQLNPSNAKPEIPSLSENLNLSDMEVSFQPQMAPDFTQAFSDQFQTIGEEKEKSFLQATSATNVPEIPSQNLPEPSTMGVSQTLHADETGTITLPNYTGDQTLTPESIREIEETLNQQLFNIGMNLGLGSNLRQISDPSVNHLETREQPVLNIIYENGKNLEPSNNGTIFSPQFDTFDMSQIALQTDSEIDIGINSANSTSMASILPRSVQEEQRLVPTTIASTEETQQQLLKTAGHQLMIVSSRQSPETTRLSQTPTKYTKIIARADTTEDVSNVAGTTTMSTENDGKSTESYEDATRCLEEQRISQMNPAGIIEGDSLLQCHMCSKRNFTTDELKEHLKTHRGTKEFQCTECQLKFCTNGGLSRHLKMHSSKQQWQCSICQKTLPSKAQLKSHLKLHDVNWSSNIAEADSSQKEDTLNVDRNFLPIGGESGTEKESVDSLVSHKVLLDTVAEKEIMDRIQGTDEKKDTKVYTNKCKYCPKTFRKPSDLIRHVRTHTGERPYKCEHCNKSFAVKCTLDSHTKVHTGKKTFCCHVCNSMFATKGSLKVHMRLHTGSKPFRCTICDLRFRTSGHRTVHLLKHAREHKGMASKRKPKHSKVAAVAEAAAELEKTVAEDPVKIDPEPENLQPTQLEYPNLDSITIDTGGLSEQITFNNDGTIISNNSMFSVNESNQIVANLHFLLANGLVTIQTDEQVLSQIPADASLVTDPSISELVPTTTFPLTCNDAANNEHIVITASQLTNDCPVQPSDPTGQVLKQPTSKQAKRECDICGKMFMKPCQVERHKRIHTGERPFKCTMCPKSFAQKVTLQMHEKHHTGDRPYVCPHCKFSFSQKCNLQTHLKKAHQMDVTQMKKLKRSQPVLATKTIPESLEDPKILEDLSFVDYLKQS